ncbi:MAG: hypothetical protein EOR73_10210 [Mesorhizobium sp.]|nr:MAG: hypothetical protein EOR73_10210 [Mesorhizobium sp.]
MLNTPPNHPLEDVDIVGLAIKRINEGQNHVGVLYKSDVDGLMMCHLAWHFDLRFDPPNDTYRWIDLDPLDEMNKKALAAFFQTLKEEGADVPYGFKVSGECFDEDGRFVPLPPGEGLTCATFVVAALRSQGHELITETTWPARAAEDAAWQAHILAHLQLSPGVTQAHLDAIAADVGATRIKPEEVVAAGLRDDWPSSYADIEQMAQAILAELAA